jgi:hypothetical protein
VQGDGKLEKLVGWTGETFQAKAYQIHGRGAAFSGDPAGGPCNGGPQQCNRHGTTFSMSGGTLWLGEIQFGVNDGKDAPGPRPGLALRSSRPRSRLYGGGVPAAAHSVPY